MKPKPFIDILIDNGFGPITGVPCSYFKSLIQYLNKDTSIKHYISSSEGEAMGIAAGFSLSGKLPIVYMQNDGYGNAINPLSSLQLMYKLPALLLISWRGEPGKKDAPQHKLMGEKLFQLLEVFNIPYKIVDSKTEIKTVIENANIYCLKKKLPYALIIKKGYFESLIISEKKVKKNLYERIMYLELLGKYITKNDILLGTTGFTGRELTQSVKHKGSFYMMGSMGCLTAIGLGLSESNPGKTIYNLDGDGALLMKMGSLSTIGFYKPDNFVHICYDNGTYESTGDQPTTSCKTDFCGVAKSCGYEMVEKISNLDEFENILKKIEEYKKPLFLHIIIKSGTIDGLPRPDITPVEMRDELMSFLDK